MRQRLAYGCVFPRFNSTLQLISTIHWQRQHNVNHAVLSSTRSRPHSAGDAQLSNPLRPEIPIPALQVLRAPIVGPHHLSGQVKLHCVGRRTGTKATAIPSLISSQCRSRGWGTASDVLPSSVKGRS